MFRVLLLAALLPVLPQGASGRPVLPSPAPVPHAFEPEPAASDFDTLLRVQIFLDSQLFCPGKIDGRTGEFTRKAVAAWNVAHDIPDTDDWHAVLSASQSAVHGLWSGYTVRKGDVAYLSPGLPTTPEEQSKSGYLGYRSLAEMVAERFHTTETFLAAVNPRLPMERLKPGDILRVPNVNPFAIEDVKPSQQWKPDPGLSSRSVLVDAKERTAAVYNEQGQLFAFFPITPGEPKFIPVGQWKIEVMMSTPEFRWDKQMLHEGVRGKEAHMLPPGPNNPVGMLWAGLSKSGIGLHGTASPETIGRSQSAGCVRFANWDVVRLPSLIRPGAKVWVKK